MRTFNFTLLAVFSCIAMISATPLRAEAIGRRQDIYIPCKDVPLQALCYNICIADPERSFCPTICETEPEWEFCPIICETDPEQSFCSTICKTEPEWPFCDSD